MTTTARASDGRRLYTPEFKRQQVDRGLKGEITLAAERRERGISRSLIQRWKQLLARDGANERWCSDSFLVPCLNGEVVEVGVVLDCCDRECVAARGQPRDLCGADIRVLMHRAVDARFGGARPPAHSRSDNEGMYAALEPVIAAERLGLMPVTTPAYSPESNGMAEAVVKTMNRDDVDGAPSARRPRCSTNSPHWIADYNGVAPHSALRYLAPHEYRQRREQRTD